MKTNVILTRYSPDELKRYCNLMAKYADGTITESERKEFEELLKKGNA